MKHAIKNNSIQAKQRLYSLHQQHQRAKYPTIPEHARPQPKYTEKTANGLTKMIIDFLLFTGQQAERVSVTGRQIDKTKTFQDAIGRTRKIGSTKWIPSTMTPGSADISATINGRSVKIEVKIGRDKQRESQKQYQQQIERAGGIYWIVKTFDDFINKYNTIINRK